MRLCTMTMGDSDRRTDAEKLLGALLEALGDDAIDVRLFDPASPQFEGFLNTSWGELETSEFVVSTPVPPDFFYRLTPSGWIEALVRHGFLNDEGIRGRLADFAAALKAKVKGRTASAVVDLDSLASETGIPAGWIFNAVDSRLINRIHRRRDASWLEGARGRLVVVPADFGMTEIDLFGDIRSQNEQLREELAAVREEISEYKCPHCSAPLSSRNDVDLDEHTIGTVESFECGYSTVDGWVESPCPSDSAFPKLEDFELRATLRANPLIPKEQWWSCFAVGKTPMAKKVALRSASGRTEAEARDRVIEQYQRISKAWHRH
jgi:hypothetical protein